MAEKAYIYEIYYSPKRSRSGHPNQYVFKVDADTEGEALKLFYVNRSRDAITINKIARTAKS